jgi:C_GCAxxG_C_C family probable redox protein
LLAVGEHLIDPFPEVCKRMGTGFSGGLGGTRQELCGALSGGVLAISALLGRSKVDEDDRLSMNTSTVYWARFLGKFGETQCAPLREKVVASEQLGSCAVLVEQATELLIDILNEMT